MLDFYSKEQLRRKERFQRELSNREAVLTETVNNLKNLVWIEAEKNFKLERKIEALRSAQSVRQNGRHDNSNLLGYSDLNCPDISHEEVQRPEDTLLLESMNEASLTLDNYI